jgi:AraC-like DNA-binding protein
MNTISSHHKAFLTTDYLTQLISLVKEQGFSTEEILNQSQLREDDFQYNSRISPMQYQQIVENALRLTQDPLLGIKHGQGLSISSHGFVGFAAMAADDLGQALSLAIRYARTRTLLADIRFHKEDDSAVIQVTRLASMPDTFPFVVENIIASFVVVARFLVGQQEALSVIIKLAHKPQADLAEYERLFGAPVLFNQPYNQICLPEFMLEVPVSTANAISRGLAETECEKLLAELDHGHDLVTKIRHELEKIQAFPTLPVMANALNSSPRTMNRQLAQLNTSYQHTLDEARREKAIELLDTTTFSIEKISTNLGYNDPSNFGRAFRRWLGQSPRSYRQSK